jgi:hypothetical protein
MVRTSGDPARDGYRHADPFLSFSGHAASTPIGPRTFGAAAPWEDHFCAGVSSAAIRWRIVSASFACGTSAKYFL